MTSPRFDPPLFARVLFLLLLGAATLAAQTVRVYEDEVVFPTYPLGPDDVNPHFRELDSSLIYPYTMQDNLTTERVDRTYRAWFLENEYLKVLCLPEIGGRIQYVLDKRRAEPMFYFNRVIRPGLIALRGAWVSGGIEWNRGPRGHTVTSFSPVDVDGIENADGSASLLIGNIEKNFRTGWLVRLTLHRGRTYLDEEIVLYNPTDGFHPYYFWNNTAFPNRPGTRFLFPMTLGTDHEGQNFFTWPIHEGKDLTWLRSYEAPTSIFAYHSVFDFFGAYDVDRDYGIVQVSDHVLLSAAGPHPHGSIRDRPIRAGLAPLAQAANESSVSLPLPGKKAWTWGQAESGLVSQSVLTDDDGPYIEIQSGPLPTQADFAPLAPGGEVKWREYWYPAFGLGEGYEYATRDVVVARVERDSGVELRFHASSDLGAVRVRASGVEQTLRLAPEATERVLVPGSPGASFDVTLRRDDGTEILSYRSPLSIPGEKPPTIEAGEPPRTPEGLFRAASELDLRMEREAARRGYLEVLALDPLHRDASIALASLDLEAGLWDDAEKRVEGLAGGMARYLAAVAALQKDESERALLLAREASEDGSTRALGLGMAGRASMRLGRAKEALAFFEAAASPDGPDRFRLLDETLIARLVSGDRRGAAEQSRRALADGTLAIVPRFVLALAEGKSLAEFGVEARHYIGEDEFEFLEGALRFADLGRLEEALDLLAESGGGLLVRCYQAYWSHRLGREVDARRFLDEIAPLSSDYVFPSRTESLEVLDFVASETGDAKVYLLKGNLLAGLARYDEAAKSFRDAVGQDETTSVAHRNLALIAWRRSGALGEAADAFRRAIASRPSDQTLYRDLARLEIERGETLEAIRVLESIPSGARRRADATLLLARAFVEAGRFDDAIDLLSRTTFSNREGDSDTWSIHASAHIERGRRRLEAGRFQEALSDFDAVLTYPRNLNVGRPAKPKEARARYFRARALEALGRLEEARESYAGCAEALPLDEEQVEYRGRCREAR